MSNVEKILADGELIVTGRLIDASNATLLAQCTLDNEIVKCIYKPIAGERPLWDFQDGNLAQREFAAYLISEYLEMHIVPLTILRDGPFGLGMVQNIFNNSRRSKVEDFRGNRFGTVSERVGGEKV